MRKLFLLCLLLVASTINALAQAKFKLESRGNTVGFYAICDGIQRVQPEAFVLDSVVTIWEPQYQLAELEHKDASDYSTALAMNDEIYNSLDGQCLIAEGMMFEGDSLFRASMYSQLRYMQRMPKGTPREKLLETSKIYTGKEAHCMMNADTIIINEYKFDYPCDKKFTSCLNVYATREGYNGYACHLLLTDEGHKQADKYLHSLLAAVRYIDNYRVFDDWNKVFKRGKRVYSHFELQ